MQAELVSPINIAITLAVIMTHLYYHTAEYKQIARDYTGPLTGDLSPGMCGNNIICTQSGESLDCSVNAKRSMLENGTIVSIFCFTPDSCTDTISEVVESNFGLCKFL